MMVKVITPQSLHVSHTNMRWGQKTMLCSVAKRMAVMRQIKCCAPGPHTPQCELACSFLLLSLARADALKARILSIASNSWSGGRPATMREKLHGAPGQLRFGRGRGGSLL